MSIMSLMLTACGGGSSMPAAPPGPSLRAYPLSQNMYPNGPITLGHDGALWVIASLAHNGTQGSLWRVTTSGAATLGYTSEYSQILPFGACTTGPDGAVWFSTLGTGVGRITPSGSVRFFALPAAAYIMAMTAGPDGAVWFTDTGTHALGRITPAGAVSEYPTSLLPYLSGGIAVGSDGALWFTSYDLRSGASTNDLIGRYSPATGFTSFAVTPGSSPTGLAAGPDGALWFTENFSNHIGRITTAGKVTQYALPAQYTSGEGMTRGTNGALWFVAGGLAVSSAVGEITTAGVPTLTPVPPPYDLAGGIVATPDGSLWLSSGSGVLRFTP